MKTTSQIPVHLEMERSLVYFYQEEWEPGEAIAYYEMLAAASIPSVRAQLITPERFRNGVEGVLLVGSNPAGWAMVGTEYIRKWRAALPNSPVVVAAPIGTKRSAFPLRKPAIVYWNEYLNRIADQIGTLTDLSNWAIILHDMAMATGSTLHATMSVLREFFGEIPENNVAVFSPLVDLEAVTQRMEYVSPQATLFYGATGTVGSETYTFASMLQTDEPFPIPERDLNMYPYDGVQAMMEVLYNRYQLVGGDSWSIMSALGGT